MDKRNITGHGKNTRKIKSRDKYTRRSMTRYELKASYEHNKRIYTVLDISADRTLDDLCSMILDAFDFTCDHLYLFNFGGRGYGSGEQVYFLMPDAGEKSTDIALSKLNLSLTQKFYFLYDFGDNWGFDIQVQKIYETSEHVIDGIVAVKGELEQYPEPEDDSDWETFDEAFDPDDEDLQDDWDDEWENDLEDSWDDGEMVSFQVTPSLTVRDILNTMDERDLRLAAGAFLGMEKSSDLAEKSIQWVQEQYARAVLHDKERLLLFMKGKAAEMFRFMMTAGIDPESGLLDWTELLDGLFIEEEDDMEELAISFLHLYSLGICVPQMDSDGRIQSFMICKEVRDIYEKWIGQSRIRNKIMIYENLEKLASALVYRYGVIEIDRLQEICRDYLEKGIRKDEFRVLLEGRLVFFGRFEIYDLKLHEGDCRETPYISVFSGKDTEKILQAREKNPTLTYCAYTAADINDFMTGNPYENVDQYMELISALWKSVQDVQVLGKLMQDITDMCMMETDPETIIGETRAILNMAGKRMTKKLQELIRAAARNMPLATRYGYSLDQLEKKE